MVRVLEDY